MGSKYPSTAEIYPSPVKAQIKPNNNTTMNHQMASAHANGDNCVRVDRFADVFDRWLVVQDGDLRSLRAAASAAASQDDDELRVRALVDRVVGHYEQYYRAKAASARSDVLPMFSPSWTSTTENLFLWAGGWRPTAAIQLLYSETGIQLESCIQGLIGGEEAFPSGIAGLTAEQLGRIDRLHRSTLRLEEDISREEAAAQDEVAGTEMVEICHGMAENGGAGVAELEAAVEKKKARMEGVLRRADQLRLGTLKAVVEVLRPAQAVRFLIAAAELHLTVHEFGVRKDAAASAAAATATAATAAPNESNPLHEL